MSKLPSADMNEVSPTHSATENRAAGAASVTRRKFLKCAALAGGFVAAPSIIPGSVLGLNGAVPPSERIVLGGLGIGPRGTHVLKWMLRERDVQFVAVCDVQKSRREAAKKVADDHHGNKDCAMYSDMREFLAARSDIDALLIATGDRWHALASIMAMRAGKDVFSEKPSSMTIAEGQAVVDTAKATGRIYQTGTQRLSEAKFVFAIEAARTGLLGHVQTARAHIAPWDAAEMQRDWLPPEPVPTKDVVDWDQWLGPCPWRPYNAAYVNGKWRGHFDFHTSCIGEWGAHTFAQSQAGLGLLDTSPVDYRYVNNPTGDGMETIFANGAKMILSRGNEWWRGSCGMRFEGSEGWVSVADGYPKPDVSSPALLNEYDRLVSQYTERTRHPMNHVRDFFDSVKSRRQTVANAEVMHRTMSAVHAANICMWLRRDLKFDPTKQEFVNDTDANGLRSRPMRKPWVI